MNVQSKGFISPIPQSHIKMKGGTQHPLQLNGIHRPMTKDTVQFAGAKGQDDEIKKEGKDLQKMDKRSEAFMPSFYRGALPLSYLSKVETKLPPDKQARIDAFKTVISVGLRPNNLSPEKEAAALAKLDNPNDAMKGILEELHLNPATLKTPVVDAFKIDRDNFIPPEVMQRCSELGLLRLKIPKEYGGMGLKQREYGQVLQTFADISSSIGTIISAHSTIGSAPLLMFGTEEQKNKYLKLFSKGESIAAFGLTEPRAGTDLKKLSTTAKLSADGKNWVLNGDKLFITGIKDAGVLNLVSGHTMIDGEDVGPTVFVVEMPFKVNESWEEKQKKFVELDKQGMRITPFTKDGFDLMMIRGTDQGFIQLRDFKVPVENVLGPRTNKKGEPTRPEGKGKIVPLLSLNRGRAGFGPYVSEAAKWFTDRTVEWAADREMFDMYAKAKGEIGRQGDMEYVKTKIGRMKIKAAALNAVSDMTSALIDANPDSSVAALSAAIKSRVTHQNWEIAEDAMELHGGNGLIKDSPNMIELAFRDAWIPKIVEGVNPAMSQFMHIPAGKEPLKEMMTIGGILNQIKNQTLAFTPCRFAVPDKGALSYKDAKWIQKKTAEFARKFGMTAIRLGDAGLARKQNTLIRAFNIVMDLFTLSSVQVKLAKEGDSLSKEETMALKGAVQILKSNIKTELKYLNPKGHPIERVESKVGEAFVQAARETRDQRGNVIDEHMAFLDKRADQWYDKLYKEVGQTPAATPPEK